MLLLKRYYSINWDATPYFGSYIGSRDGNIHFKGEIDNPSVWNRALTQSEIQNYMSCPPTGNEAGLVGYWNFNEGSGNTVTDLTSNGNNGTINGASWSTQTQINIATIVQLGIVFMWV